MVADYSSYLEYIGAVYFTMSLNNYLTKRIWSPQDEKKINRSLDGLFMKSDKNFKQAVLDANREKGKILQNELSKKSLIGLLVIAFLLIFCGIEQSFSQLESNELFLLQLELVYTCVYFLFSLFVFQWVMYKKWKYVIFYFVSILFVFGIIHWKELYFNRYAFELYLAKNVGVFVCLCVTLPILWQIFITWLYKSVFYGYVKSKIIQAQDEYQKVLEYVNTKQFKKLPKRYHEIYMRISQDSETKSPQQALDDSLIEYIGVLYNDIRTIGLNVKLYQLFCSWVKFRIVFIVKSITNLFKRKKSNKLGVMTYADYADKYQKQKLVNKSLKMKEFCEEEKIIFDEFFKYYSKWCQNHKCP